VTTTTMMGLKLSRIHERKKNLLQKKPQVLKKE
jgi:hypothetical protein